MSSKLPSGFKNREEYNEYMKRYKRKYRVRKRAERADRLKELDSLRKEKAEWLAGAENVLDYAIRLLPRGTLKEWEQVAEELEAEGWTPTVKPQVDSGDRKLAVDEPKKVSVEDVSRSLLRTMTNIFECRRLRDEPYSATDTLLVRQIEELQERLGMVKPLTLGKDKEHVLKVPDAFLFKPEKPEPFKKDSKMSEKGKVGDLYRFHHKQPKKTRKGRT